MVHTSFTAISNGLHIHVYHINTLVPSSHPSLPQRPYIDITRLRDEPVNPKPLIERFLFAPVGHKEHPFIQCYRTVCHRSIR